MKQPQPQLHEVTTGDTFAGSGWRTTHESIVLKVGDIQQRFGKDDRILTVCVCSVDRITHKRTVIDAKKLMWWSDLRKGLV